METAEITSRLFQPVEKVELKTIFPGRSFPRANDHAIIDSNGGILSFCSSSYNLRSNSTLYKPLEEMMTNQKIPFDSKIQIIDDTKFYVDYIIRERVKSLTVNDILPKISIWNSYDGTVKTVLKFGFYRVVCANGLTRPEGEQINISKKHRKGVKAEDGVDLSLLSHDKILENIKIFLVEAKKDIFIYEKMNHIESDVKRILQIAEKLNMSKNLVETAINRFDLETSKSKSLTYVNENGEIINHEGSPATLYAVYNALNYAIYNCNQKELPEAKLKRDKLVLAEVLA